MENVFVDDSYLTATANAIRAKNNSTDTYKPSEFANAIASISGGGADGVGIQSVVQTTTSAEDGGTNVITVTKTDGTTSTFQVKNGSKGSDGVPGADGKDGADGQPGADGKSAYQYAQEGGYTGTEEEFAVKMAQEIPIVDDTLKIPGQAADAAVVGEQLGNLSDENAELKSDLDHIISKTNGSFTSDDLSVFTTIEDDKYTKGGSPTSLANYKMMYFKATKDFHFWCDENCTDSTQFYICVFRNDTISTANNVNKYLINDTSTPLPTVDNKGFCESGNLFVVSILTPNTSPKYFRIETDYIDGEVKLKDSLGLPATGRQEVADMIEEEVASTIRKKYLQYSAITTSTSTEEVNIYIPTYKGYIQYKFIHTVVDAKHSDVWRIDRAYSCEEDLTQIKQLTTDGEWEFAFGLYDRPTGISHFGSGFIGGKQHGNEVMNSIVFIIDGKVTDITTLTDVTEWKTLEIYENTTMYDSSDNTTPCCEHGTLHAFNDNGVVVKQSVKWLIETKMRTSYLAMFPVAKTVTDTLMVDNTWKRENTIPSSGTGIRYDRAKFAILSKDSEGFIGKFYITEYPSGLDSIGDYFLCTDNTTDYSGIYNKCYFTITGNSGNCIVNVGDIWKSETHYELLVSN